jgi:hypothetical protein
MKYFKCGKCQSLHKIDESKVGFGKCIIACRQCGVKNAMRFGPSLIAHSKSGQRKFELKLGENKIGRDEQTSEADIKLDDKFLSRRHATVFVEQRNGKVLISILDAMSLNGTFNRTRTRLRPGIKYPFNRYDYYVLGLTKLSISL